MLDTETLEDKRLRDQEKRKNQLESQDEEEGVEMVTKKQSVPEII